MAERPPIPGTGVVREEKTAGRLYVVEMANSYRVMAIVPKEGPLCPDAVDPVGIRVSTIFSPYDMSRCRIVEWQVE